MKRYYVPLGRMGDYEHPAPERTAYRRGEGMFADMCCQVWPSRGAMLQACKMGDTHVWKPLPLCTQCHIVIWGDKRCCSVEVKGKEGIND